MNDLCLEAANYTLDSYYINLLLLLSKGETVEKLCIKENKLLFEDKEFEVKTPQELLNAVIKCCNGSQTQCLKFEDWKKIKPKYIKNILITKFVLSKKEQYNLTEKESIRLYSIVQLGLQLKTITHTDIVYEDGEILDITVLVFDDKSPEKFYIEDSDIHEDLIKETKNTNKDEFKKIVDQFFENSI
jgi:hypothetical protein